MPPSLRSTLRIALALLAAVAPVVAASPAAAAPVLNSFDAGLVGWTVSGDPSHR